MAKVLQFGVLPAVLACLAGPAMAQIESHCLPPEMPATLLPNSVLVPPPFESQDLSAPLARPSAKPQSAGADGSPDATSLANMCKEPREIIGLAEAGKFKEAAQAGELALNQAREKYRDYTWDYLGNAVAWSFIQLGDLKKATQVHLLAAARIDDQAVADYHRAAAKMLGQTKKSAGEMKQYATYQAELRAGLADRIEAFKQNVAAAQKAVNAEAQFNNLRDAYAKLRVFAATDADLGKREASDAFHKAARGLIANVIPAQLEEARQIGKRLHESLRQGIYPYEYDDWNSSVNALWAKVAYVKRLCRIYDYLVRMKLADASGDPARFGREVHGLLFVPDKPKLVWQEFGQGRIFNNVTQVDIRVMVPWQQTKISPWGVPAAAQAAVQPGWQPVDGQMKPMTGQMKPMTGQMKPMTGQMKPKYR
jgi:hypothetical protein